MGICHNLYGSFIVNDYNFSYQPLRENVHVSYVRIQKISSERVCAVSPVLMLKLQKLDIFIFSSKSQYESKTFYLKCQTIS